MGRHGWTRQELADWGTFDATMDYAGRGRRGAPRPIRSAGEYVAVCRGLAAQRGVQLPSDGRLIAVGYCHCPPAEWIGLRGVRVARSGGVRPSQWADSWSTWEDAPTTSPLRSWLAYWSATQPRPERPGSTYSEIPELVAELWRRGIPVRAYPYGYAYLVATGRGAGSRRRLRAVMALAQICPVREASECWIPKGAGTRSIILLAKMPAGLLRYLAARAEVGRDVFCPGTGRIDRTELRLAVEEWKRWRAVGWHVMPADRRRKLALWAKIQGGNPLAICEWASSLTEAGRRLGRDEGWVQGYQDRYFGVTPDELARLRRDSAELAERKALDAHVEACRTVAGALQGSRLAALEMDGAAAIGTARAEWAAQVDGEARRAADRERHRDQAAARAKKAAEMLAAKQARFNRAVSAPRDDREREWAAEQDAQEARRRAHLAAQVKAQRAEQDRVRTAQAAARENANNGGRWAALELD